METSNRKLQQSSGGFLRHFNNVPKNAALSHNVFLYISPLFSTLFLILIFARFVFNKSSNNQFSWRIIDSTAGEENVTV